MRPRVSLRLSMLVLAGMALVLVPLTAPSRRAARWQARRAHAFVLAQACLKARGWAVPRSALEVFPAGDRAFRIDIRRVGNGDGSPESVIVPHEDQEPLVVVLDEVGRLSGDHSKVRIARDDFRVIEVSRAE